MGVFTAVVLGFESILRNPTMAILLHYPIFRDGVRSILSVEDDMVIKP